jgi:hypothetical protein
VTHFEKALVDFIVKLMAHLVNIFYRIAFRRKRADKSVLHKKCHRLIIEEGICDLKKPNSFVHQKILRNHKSLEPN